MTVRLPAVGNARFIAGFFSALALIASFIISTSIAGAAAGDVTLSKTSNATNPEAPGGTYTYTLVATNTGTTQATGVVVADGSLDPGQLTVTSASYTTSGGQSGTCNIPGSTDVLCAVSTLEPAESATVTIQVQLAALAQACPDNGAGGIDSTILNRAEVDWSDGNGGPFHTDAPAIGTPAHKVNIDCTGAAADVQPQPQRKCQRQCQSQLAAPSGGPTVTRLFGSDRYETAAKLSQRLLPTPGAGVQSVYVATGAQFPDALAGAPAANERGTSMLLVRPTSIPSFTAAELTRLNPNTIYVLGGTGAVSASVATQLEAYARGSVVRLAGASRYETAAAIVANAFPTSESQVMIATGADFADAMAGAGAAGEQGMPILLTLRDSLPAATQTQLDRLNPTTIWVLGGEGAVSASVATQLGAYGTVSRLSGADRYATAIDISQQFFGASEHADIFVATGVAFPDALAAGAFGQPVLLTRAASLPAGVGAEATRLNPDRITVLGGPTVISETVVIQLRAT